MKKYYHATFDKNIGKIMQEGIKAGGDGVIYLAESPQEAAAFLIIRHANWNQISAVEIELIDNDPLLEESCDHNKKYLPYKAWRYNADLIPPKRITEILKFCDTEEMDFNTPW